MTSHVRAGQAQTMTSHTVTKHLKMNRMELIRFGEHVTARSAKWVQIPNPKKREKNMVVEDSVSRPIKWGSENDPKLELSRSCFLNKFKVNVSCPETQS